MLTKRSHERIISINAAARLKQTRLFYCEPNGFYKQRFVGDRLAKQDKNFEQVKPVNVNGAKRPLDVLLSGGKVYLG
jgi:hypothetical protein